MARFFEWLWFGCWHEYDLRDIKHRIVKYPVGPEYLETRVVQECQKCHRIKITTH